MAVEVEAKLKVDSHEAVRARLIDARAQCLGRVLETNQMFDSADRTLLANDSGLRVRVCGVQEGEAPPATMAYKGPKQPSPLKQREEIEITLDDPAAGRRLLERLGFVEVLCFEKRRESWRLDDCHVELDELPHLGRYVEIEGPDEQAVRRTQEALGLAGHTLIHDTYIALLVEHCQQNGLPAEQITFEQSQS
jgi:predicted adenylyl cyclase CyaB